MTIHINSPPGVIPAVDSVERQVPDELWKRLLDLVPALQPTQFPVAGCPRVSARNVLAMWLWAAENERPYKYAPQVIFGCNPRTVGRRLIEWGDSGDLEEIVRAVNKFRAEQAKAMR